MSHTPSWEDYTDAVKRVATSYIAKASDGLAVRQAAMDEWQSVALAAEQYRCWHAMGDAQQKKGVIGKLQNMADRVKKDNTLERTAKCKKMVRCRFTLTSPNWFLPLTFPS